MNKDPKKIKLVYRCAVVYFIIVSLFLLFPPLVALFDRNDIWVGPMPLSQFYILLFTALIVIGMGVVYMFDKKYDNDEIDEEESKK
jgi:hypothetical protein